MSKCPFLRCQWEKSIIIMRNPFDALISDFKLSRGSKTSEPDPSAFEGPDFHDYIMKKAPGWYTLHYNWITKNNDIELHWTCFDRFINSDSKTIQCRIYFNRVSGP